MLWCVCMFIVVCRVLSGFLEFDPLWCYCKYTEIILKCVCLWFPQAGLHKLELNPYWKEGGTGLPPEESAGTAVKKGNNHLRLVDPI